MREEDLKVGELYMATERIPYTYVHSGNVLRYKGVSAHNFWSVFEIVVGYPRCEQFLRKTDLRSLVTGTISFT